MSAMRWMLVTRFWQHAWRVVGPNAPGLPTSSTIPYASASAVVSSGSVSCSSISTEVIPAAKASTTDWAEAAEQQDRPVTAGWSCTWPPDTEKLALRGSTARSANSASSTASTSSGGRVTVMPSSTRSTRASVRSSRGTSSMVRSAAVTEIVSEVISLAVAAAASATLSSRSGGRSDGWIDTVTGSSTAVSAAAARRATTRSSGSMPDPARPGTARNRSPSTDSMVGSCGATSESPSRARTADRAVSASTS